MDFLKYFGKKENSRTKFDFGNNNIYSQRLGELLPVYAQNYMPDDEIRHQLNALVKTPPLNAPAFARLNNHFYAYGTNYSSIWHHWNDFLSDGKFKNNIIQSITSNDGIDADLATGITEGKYKVPTMNMGAVVATAKIADGWACPVIMINGSVIDEYTVAGIDSDDVNSRYEATVQPRSVTNTQAATSVTSNVYYIKPSQFATLYTGNFTTYKSRLTSQAEALEDEDEKAAKLAEIEELEENFEESVEVVSKVATRYQTTIITNINGTAGQRANFRTALFFPSVAIRDFVLNEVKKYTGSYAMFGLSQTAANVTSTFGSTDSSDTDYNEYYASINFALFSDEANTSTPRPEWRPWIITWKDLSARVYNIQEGSTANSLNDNIKVKTPIWEANEDSIYWTKVTDSTTGDVVMHLNPNICVAEPNTNVATTIDAFNSTTATTSTTATFCTCAVPISICDAVSAEETYVASDFSFLDTAAERSAMANTFNDVFSSCSLESVAKGFTSLGFAIYQIQNTARLFDYMGLQTDILVGRSVWSKSNQQVSLLPFMAYQKIWETYFRDKQLQAPVMDYKNCNGLIYSFGFTSGDDDYNDAIQKGLFSLDLYENGTKDLHYVAKNFQNWTQELSQRFYFAVFVGTCNFRPLNEQSGFNYGSVIDKYEGVVDTEVTIDSDSHEITDGPTEVYLAYQYYSHLGHLQYKNIESLFGHALLDPNGTGEVVQTPDTIIEMRSAKALQGIWDRVACARNINNWYESIWGTKPSAHEYEYPIYCGKESMPIQIGEVLQTSETTENSAQGERSGVAVGGGERGLCSFIANEHGIYMVLSCIDAKVSLTGGQSLNFYAPTNFLDLPMSQFAHIGNEELQNKYVSSGTPRTQRQMYMYYTNSSGTDTRRNSGSSGWNGGENNQNLTATERSNAGYGYIDEGANVNYAYLNQVYGGVTYGPDATFGFLPRYTMHKVKFDETHGEFNETLEYWHSNIRLRNPQALGHEFITWEFKNDMYDLGRLFAVSKDTVADKFYVDLFNNVTIKRALPLLSQPNN